MSFGHSPYYLDQWSDSNVIALTVVSSHHEHIRTTDGLRYAWHHLDILRPVPARVRSSEKVVLRVVSEALGCTSASALILQESSVLRSIHRFCSLKIERQRLVLFRCRMSNVSLAVDYGGQVA